MRVTEKPVTVVDFTNYLSILINKQKLLKLYEVAENNALTLSVIIFTLVHLFS